MKHCNRCKTHKDESEFNKNSKKTDGLQAYCRQCAKENSASFFQNNKQKLYAKRTNARKTLKQKVDEYKASKGCYSCKANDVAFLDFHHLNDKIENVATMVAQRTSEQKIFDEINKCVVLCSNCHRKLHYYNLTIEELAST